MRAIHAFLSDPEAIRKLAEQRPMRQASGLASLPHHETEELPLELANGHVQLDWASGRWSVSDWKPSGQAPLEGAWIQPEENLLSALIRPPCYPETNAPTDSGGTILEKGALVSG